MRNFFLSFFKTKQKLYTKLIIFSFLIANTFFNFGGCEECCEKYFGCNFGSKKEEEENVTIFGNIQGRPIDINNSENFNTLSVVFRKILNDDLNLPENVNIENIQKEENFDQFFKVSIENFTFCVKLLKEDYEKIQGFYKSNNALNQETANLYTLRKKPNFLKFYGSYIFQNRVFICTDYCDDGNLKTFIDNLPHGEINSELYKSFSRQLFNILQILREKKITHRNIKLEKFFVIKNNNFEIVLGDFRSSFQYSKNEKDWNLECHEHSNYLDFNKSPIIYHQYFLNLITQNKKSKIECYNAYNEDLFAVALILYYLKNEKKYPTFAKKFSCNSSEERNLVEENIQDFNNYFNTADYNDHKDELYNKIFLKFKDKNNNDTIDIDDFINELNT